VDGTKDIVELTQDEVRHRTNGQLFGYAFVAPDGKRRLFLGVDGDLTYIKDGRDELPLLRDADATSLGPATIAGSPPPPPPREKTANEIAAAELTEISVMKKFPQFKTEDAGDLAKVAEAYQLVTADMLVTCNDQCDAWYAPYPVPGGNGYGGLGFVDDKKLSQGPATEDEKKSPLAKYNAWIRAEYEFGDWSHQPIKSAWLNTFQLEFRKLHGKTPGIVWNVEKTDVFIVTLDGGRYWESAASNDKPVFTKGVAPVAEWSPPLRNNLLFKTHVAEMSKRGLVDKKAADEIADINEKFGECAQKTFLPAQKEIEGNMTGTTQYFSARNRNALVLRKYNDKAMKDCRGTRAATLYAQILAKRETDQKALYEKNKTRVLGLVK
jgi:hypothetical protein